MIAGKVIADYNKLKEEIEKLGFNGDCFLSRIQDGDMFQNYVKPSAECRHDYIELSNLGFNVEVDNNPKKEGCMLRNKDYIKLVIT